MRAVDDTDRQTLLRIAAILVCGGVALLPLTLPPASLFANARSMPERANVAVPQFPGRLEFPDVRVGRDPFVAQAMPGTRLGNSQRGAPVLRGVVLGEEPQALVDVGGIINVYSSGDRIGALSIRSIDSGGVTLEDGSRLLLAPGSQ